MKLNVFGRHGKLFFTPELCRRYGVELNTELYEFYRKYKTKDAGYTGTGYDEETGEYIPQNRTSTGMFGNIGYLDHEPFIGNAVYNQDGSVRVSPIAEGILENAKAFSDTAVVVLYRHGGEGADHEKGDERLSEGEAAELSFCTEHFEKVIVILATNSVIDGDFLAEDMDYKFYQYTYGGGVYSNNIGNEILTDFASRVELRYVDAQGNPAPHVYPIRAEKLGGVFYTCNNPGRTTAALRNFMKGCMNSLLESHTFRDLYTDYDYYSSEDADFTTDTNWFDAQIGLGYAYHQAESLTYLGIKLQEGESNPPSMVPNFNCKDRGGTIRTDDYGLTPVNISGSVGQTLTIPVSIQKSYGMQKMGFTIGFDRKTFVFTGIGMEGSILAGYDCAVEETPAGIDLRLSTSGNVFSRPCGKLFDLRLTVKGTAQPGNYPIRLLPVLDEQGGFTDSLLDKQGHEMSYTLTSQTEKYKIGSGWSGVYQDVESAAWQTEADGDLDDLADVTLLSGTVTVI